MQFAALFSEMPENGDFHLSFEFFHWVLSISLELWGGEYLDVNVFSLTTLYLLKNSTLRIGL